MSKAKDILKHAGSWAGNPSEIDDIVSESPSLIAAPLPDCDICHRHQTEPGALRFGPPRKIDGLEGMWCKKIHICVRCIKEEK